MKARHLLLSLMFGVVVFLAAFGTMLATTGLSGTEYTLVSVFEDSGSGLWVDQHGNVEARPVSEGAVPGDVETEPITTGEKYWVMGISWLPLALLTGLALAERRWPI